MGKKKATQGTEPFLSPLVKRLAEDLHLPALDKQEIEEIKKVESSGGSKVVIVSHWDGASSKTWAVSSMDNTPAEYESTVRDMLEADADQAYWAHIYTIKGEAFELRGETIKVTYTLDPM